MFNFGKRDYENHFKKNENHLKIFLILTLVTSFQRSRTVCAISIEGIIRNIPVTMILILVGVSGGPRNVV